MDVEAVVLVSREIAESFPRRPDRVAEVKRQAEVAMNQKAAERNRKVCSEPELVDLSDHALAPSLVELKFQSRTRSF